MNKPKICEFGYVLCDENFKILKDEDILINPGKGGSFVSEHRGVFNYYHPLHSYYKSKEYSYYYEYIKNLIIDKDTIVLGFAVNGDIEAINVGNRRYKKEDYEIEAYDVQRLLPEYKESKSKQSLERVFMELYKDRDEYYDVVAHKPDDDAYMTMLILKNIVEINNVKLHTLLKENEQIIYNSKKGYFLEKNEKDLN